MTWEHLDRILGKGQSRKLRKEAHEKMINEKTKTCSFLVEWRRVSEGGQWMTLCFWVYSGRGQSDLPLVGAQYFHAKWLWKHVSSLPLYWNIQMAGKVRWHTVTFSVRGVDRRETVLCCHGCAEPGRGKPPVLFRRHASVNHKANCIFFFKERKACLYLFILYTLSANATGKMLETKCLCLTVVELGKIVMYQML